MTEPSSQSHAMAEAMKWASRATAIAAEMVLPGIAGQWADQQLGTSFLTLTGFAFGLSVALWHLIQLAREAEKKRLAAQSGDNQASDTKPTSTPDRASDKNGSSGE